MPVKKCNKVNCDKLIDFRESYCDEHKQLSKQSNKDYDVMRNNRDKKYRKTYNSKRWNDIRKVILQKNDYVCGYCLYKNKYTRATCVDHFIPIRDDYEKRFDTENLIPSCDSCNTVKQEDEQLLRQNIITLEEYKLRWSFIKLNK